VVVIECQEKNRGEARFFPRATSSPSPSLQLVWDAMKQMSAEIENDSTHRIVPRMREDARAQTAAKVRKDAEE
jgi:hypothetical protein